MKISRRYRPGRMTLLRFSWMCSILSGASIRTWAAPPAAAPSAIERSSAEPLRLRDSATDDVHILFFPVRYDDRQWGIDPNSLQLGGAVAADYLGQGAPPHQRGASSSLTIHAMPYGNYDSAAALSIIVDAKRRESSRDGIGAGLESGDGAGPVGPLSAYPDFEAVNLYSLTHSADAPLILQHVTYDAHHIYPHPALTPAQRAQLRFGMNVISNSTDPGLPAPSPGKTPLLPLMNTYGGFIDGWSADGSAIHVIGWTVLGGHDPHGGQVPGDRLDTRWTHYQTKTCFLGAATKDFLNVWVMGFDPTRDADGTPTTSLVHRFEGLELDMYNEARSDYEASFHGLTINYSPHTYLDKGTSRQRAVRPAADSYDMLLGGDGIQNILRLTGGPSSTEIDGTTLHVDGNTGIPPQATGRDTRTEELESMTEAEGNRLRMVVWGQRNDAEQGWRSVTMNVGLIVDGAVGNPAAGSPMGKVSFNPPGHPGGISLLTADGSGLTVENGGGVSFSTRSFRMLPRNAAGGTNFFCSDCLAAHEQTGHGSGMNVVMNASGRWMTSGGVEARN